MVFLALQLLTFGLGAAGPSPSHNVYLEHGRALFSELRYAEALSELELAERVPSDPGAEKVEILELEARCQVAQGRLKDARQTLVRLLRTDPDFHFGADDSPKILEVFDQARREATPPPVPKPVVQAPIQPLMPAATLPPPRSRFSRPLPWVVVSTGFAFLAAGVVLEELSAAKVTAARNEPWVDTARRRQSEAINDGRWGVGLLGAGGLGVLGGSALFLF